MVVIGLCGGSGSGKGSVSLLFSKHNILPVDTDKVYHDLIGKPSKCIDALVGEFGTGILNSCGLPDRKKLAQIVFSDKQKLSALNSISHFYVLEEVRKIIADSEGKYFAVMVDAPLLFESGFDRECDAVISVIADAKVRIQRIMLRDSIDENSAIKRINAQKSDEFLIARSDYTIVNNGDLIDLEKKVDEVFEKIKSNFEGEENV